jgi:hypothetical protein
MKNPYKAIVSSDWNQCLAPCGPFDCISYTFPDLQPALAEIFRQYTGNFISLGNAVAQIRNWLPAPITPGQMDAYLDENFFTYTGVSDLIEWCSGHDILFMINTTGMIGYFQRVFAKDLLPPVPVLSALTMVRYPRLQSDPCHVYELTETRDKGIHTAAVARSMGISAENTILMGDSGGDGPHFEWGAKAGAFLIGTMTKPSLARYCRVKDIVIDLRFGLDYSRGDKRGLQKELRINFMDLAPRIQEIANR